MNNKRSSIILSSEQGFTTYLITYFINHDTGSFYTTGGFEVKVCNRVKAAPEEPFG